MTDEKKPILWMILFGISRHLLSIAGAWLASRGLIDAETHERILSEGASQLVGYIMMLVPIIWSVMQKFQVIARIKAALHLDAGATLAEVADEATTITPTI